MRSDAKINSTDQGLTKLHRTEDNGESIKPSLK